MSDEHLPAATRQAVAIPGRSRRGAVTGKLKAALDLMVWSGDKRADELVLLSQKVAGSEAENQLFEEIQV
jgi:hypothetical protein